MLSPHYNGNISSFCLLPRAPTYAVLGNALELIYIFSKHDRSTEFLKAVFDFCRTNEAGVDRDIEACKKQGPNYKRFIKLFWQPVYTFEADFEV